MGETKDGDRDRNQEPGAAADFDPALLRHETYQSPGLECDVVMKGGITSGIVYPRAVCRIARDYELRSLGGTSAGAIAAAAAAAAEHGRAAAGGGFAELARLPDWLRAREGEGGTPNLLRLFRPAPALKPLFDLLLLGARPAWRRPVTVARIVAARCGPWPALLAAPGALVLAASSAWPAALATGAISWTLSVWAVLTGLRARRPDPDGPPREMERRGGLALALAGLLLFLGAGFALLVGPLGWRTAVTAAGGWLLLALGLAAGAAVGLVARAARELPRNGFGICNGRGGTDARPALTDWLHERIETLAGPREEQGPLTFGHLERAGIELRVLTTGVTHGRPYLLPNLPRQLYFDPDEMRALFPAEVVEHMVADGRERVRRDAATKQALTHHFMHPRLPLPRGRALPVLVATRMSLSFPLLLSAVPLWDFDWNLAENNVARRRWRRWRTASKANRAAVVAMGRDPDSRSPAGAPAERARPERVWFSDGGITSNFPLHLFDSPLPMRPTMAINLKYSESRTLSEEARVELARDYSQGLNEAWSRLGDGPGAPLRFLGAIFQTMQNWTDNSLLPLPGFRDRVAHVHLAAGEGGLNLDMDPEVIRRVAGYGERAGGRLARRFERRAPDGELDWASHRWTRFRTSMALLEGWIERLLRAARDPRAPTYAELVVRGPKEPPRSYRWASGPHQVRVARHTLQVLELLERAWRADPELPALEDRKTPRPRPELRIMPVLERRPERGAPSRR